MSGGHLENQRHKEHTVWVYSYICFYEWIRLKWGFFVPQGHILRVLLGLKGHKTESHFQTSVTEEAETRINLDTFRSKMIPENHPKRAGNLHVYSAKKWATAGRTVLNARGSIRKTLKIWGHFTTFGLVSFCMMR